MSLLKILSQQKSEQVGSQVIVQAAPCAGSSQFHAAAKPASEPSKKRRAECEHVRDTTAGQDKSLDFSILSEFSVGTGLFAQALRFMDRMFGLFSAAVQSGTGIEVPGPIVGDSLLCRQYEQLSLLILTAAALTVSVLASLPTLVVM